MKKTLITLAILAACGASIAGGSHNPTPTPTTPATTVQGGAGGKGTGVGIAAAQSLAFGAGGAGGAGGLGGNGFGGTGMGGLGGTGGSVGNLTAGGVDLSGARIGSGDVNVPRQTPPSYAPPASTPPTSCRLTMGGGGADDKVSLSLGFPIGNDAVCLHKKRDALMQAANARKPSTFSQDDFLRNDCTVEGMADTSACKALAQKDADAARATAVLEGRPAPLSTSQTGRALPAEYGG